MINNHDDRSRNPKPLLANYHIARSRLLNTYWRIFHSKRMVTESECGLGVQFLKCISSLHYQQMMNNIQISLASPTSRFGDGSDNDWTFYGDYFHVKISIIKGRNRHHQTKTRRYIFPYGCNSRDIWGVEYCIPNWEHLCQYLISTWCVLQEYKKNIVKEIIIELNRCVHLWMCWSTSLRCHNTFCFLCNKRIYLIYWIGLTRATMPSNFW